MTRTMIGRFAVASFFFFMFVTASGEPIEDIVVGATYWRNGFYSDQKVEVVRVDYRNNRVKVFNPESGEVFWLKPSDIDNSSLATKKALNRVSKIAELIEAFYKYSKQREQQSGDTTPNLAALAEWRVGQPHERYPNVISGAERNTWRPASGYDWVDRENSWSVQWTPGAIYPNSPERVASHDVGKWTTPLEYMFTTLQLEEKTKDANRTQPFTRPPGVIGALFGPDELTLYCTGFQRCRIFHNKKVSYESISHLEYHKDNHWVAVVLKDARRLDLGVNIEWQIRPSWREMSIVEMVRTEDGVALEGNRFEIRHLTGREEIGDAAVYRLGFVGEDTEIYEFSGAKYVGGVKIKELLPGYPAKAAGLRNGDIITNIGNQAVFGMSQFKTMVNSARGREAAISVLRDDRFVRLRIEPTRIARPYLNE